jgi:hypothetical protein
MRVPRFRVWILMLVVALAAMASAGWVLVTRSREYSTLAESHEARVKRALKNLEYYTSRYWALRKDYRRLTKRLVQVEREEAEQKLGVTDDTRSSSRSEPPGQEIRRIKMFLRVETEALSEAERRIDTARATIKFSRPRVTPYRRAARYPWLGPPRIESANR